MIFEEEDIAKIVKRNKLAEIGNSMVPAIKFCIEKNTKYEKSPLLERAGQRKTY